MTIEDFIKLINDPEWHQILLMLIVPIFICLFCILAIKLEKKVTLETIIPSLILGFICYNINIELQRNIELKNVLLKVMLYAITVPLVFLIILIGFLKLVSLVIGRQSKTASAWDYYFSKKKVGAFVIMTLHSGDKVAAYYGTKSKVSSFPYEKDLYFEKLYDYNMDTEEIEEIPNSNGIYIKYSEIKHMEFIFNGDKGKKEETIYAKSKYWFFRFIVWFKRLFSKKA